MLVLFKILYVAYLWCCQKRTRENARRWVECRILSCDSDTPEVSCSEVELIAWSCCSEGNAGGRCCCRRHGGRCSPVHHGHCRDKRRRRDLQVGQSHWWGSVVHLVMSCLEFGLQVCGRMEVLAFLPGASAFDVIHADSHSIVIYINHGRICGVSVAAIVLTPGTISTLKFSANLQFIRTHWFWSSCSCHRQTWIARNQNRCIW